MYNTLAELFALAEEQRVPLWEIILKNEKKITELTEEEIFSKLDQRYEVMVRSTQRALYQKLPTVGNLIEGIANCQYTFATADKSVCGGFINLLMARALSCSESNASMGRICAAPTAGACGVVPAVLVSVSEKYVLNRQTTLEGLLTASGIGVVITENATVSGAEGGCQAECGVAAAMAAAAAAQMIGGSNNMVLNACSFALMNCMGLICDPVAGLVQVPCAQRNASQAVNAVISADLALSGMKSIIPVDEVIEAMYSTGKLLPTQLRETALGGIAATATGKNIKTEIFG